MKSLYLLIDVGTILVPLVFSFHPKLLFYKTWKAFFPAVFIAAVVFLIWDALFTHLGVWGFNLDYVTGFRLWNLPIEEILFFFCIPYACVFTFHCLQLNVFSKLSRKYETAITLLLVVAFAAIGLLHFDRLYTASTFISFSFLLVLAKYVFKVTWLTTFYAVYAVLLIPFFIVNGLLTGTGLDAPVVWYNDAENLGVRWLTIPVEDIFYGMELFLLNLLVYKRVMTAQMLPSERTVTIE
jgi:lycopene cyclase domain-containing protein